MKFFDKIINRKKNSENKILLELYFALVEKYSQLQSKDSEAQALNFLNLCLETKLVFGFVIQEFSSEKLVLT